MKVEKNMAYDNYRSTFLMFLRFFFIIIILLTSSIGIFGAFEEGIYKSIDGKKEVSYSYPESDQSISNYLPKGINKMDSIYNIVQSEFGTEIYIEIHDVHSPEETYLVEVNRDPGTYWKIYYIF